MRRVLLILTKSVEPLNDIVTVAQQHLPEVAAETIDLTVESPDYPRLLEAIFAADSVQVW
ncbi:MAG: hypothetical protein KF833_15900 [Verrucomicrobiae bacterium]|nr:hypothetical protein [Verrucomicrobiae bacterium]